MYPFTESPSLTLYGREETNETDSTYFWELALPPNSKFLLDDERFFAALRMQEPPTSIHNDTQGDLFGYENLSGTETEYIQSDPVDPNELFSSHFPYSTTPKKMIATTVIDPNISQSSLNDGIKMEITYENIKKILANCASQALFILSTRSVIFGDCL
jgi:hypothetical protein